MRVLVSGDVLAAFRRRAVRRYPREYMETIWGKMVNGDAHIFSFQTIPHTGTRETCEYVYSDIVSQREDAEEDGLTMLGTIHTHPDGGSGPSESDMETARTDGDMVSGILQVLRVNGKKRTHFCFFVAQVSDLAVTRIKKGDK